MTTKGRNQSNPAATKHNASKQSGAKKPSPKVVQKANKSRQGSQQKSKMFGAVGGYGGVSRKTAKQMVNSSVRPTIQAMLRDRKLVNNQADDAVTDANTLYDRSVSGLNNIFGAADQGIARAGQAINTGFDTTKAQVAGTDATGAAQVESNNAATQQAIMSELQRLGLDTNMGVSSDVMADGGYAQNVMAQGAANNQANLGLSQQAANTVTGLLGGMIQGSKASNMGQALNTRNDDITDVNRAKRDDLSEIMGSIQELRKSKPAMIRDMLMQLQAQGFDQWQAIQALNMDRRSLNHSIGMDRAGMAEDGSYYSTLAGAFGAQAGAGAPVGNPVKPVRPGSYVGGPPKKPTKGNRPGRTGPIPDSLP